MQRCLSRPLGNEALLRSPAVVLSRCRSSIAEHAKAAPQAQPSHCMLLAAFGLSPRCLSPHPDTVAPPHCVGYR
jgi:hypothetical protein